MVPSAGDEAPRGLVSPRNASAGQDPPWRSSFSEYAPLGTIPSDFADLEAGGPVPAGVTSVYPRAVACGAEAAIPTRAPAAAAQYTDMGKESDDEHAATVTPGVPDIDHSGGSGVARGAAQPRREDRPAQYRR